LLRLSNLASAGSVLAASAPNASEVNSCRVLRSSPASGSAGTGGPLLESAAGPVLPIFAEVSKTCNSDCTEPFAPAPEESPLSAAVLLPAVAAPLAADCSSNGNKADSGKVLPPSGDESPLLAPFLMRCKSCCSCVSAPCPDEAPPPVVKSCS